MRVSEVIQSQLEDKINRDNWLNLIWSVPHGPRSVIQYKNATTVNIRGLKQIVMGGFRFMGQYSKNIGPYAEFSSYPVTASISTNLGAQSAIDYSNWYAVFATRSLLSTAATIKIMPYLRCSSVAGNVISLGLGGEGSNPATSKTYNMATNALLGSDVLVVNETLDGRANAFSGRIAKITANTNGSITVDSIGTIGQGDYLLPSPPGADYYCYLGSFYMDTAEVRNIADTGTIVGSRGSSITGFNGAIAAPGTDINFAGYICPLATGVRGAINQTFATVTLGDFDLTIGTDGSSHTVWEWYQRKDYNSNLTVTDTTDVLPFSFWQKLNFQTAGALAASGTRSFVVMGWNEL